MDDLLADFAAKGAPALPRGEREGHLQHDGAALWYASYGSGPPVILLHGGLGNAGNWGNQIAALRDAGYQIIVTDTRGHGRSSTDEQVYHYRRLATDVLALMDHLAVREAALIGWSDGACTALELAILRPHRVTGVFFFACNVAPDGTLPFVLTPTIENCFTRHRLDYQALSATPDNFEAFVDAVGAMQRSEPQMGAADLSAITVPVTVALSEHDEFIKPEHADWMAASLGQARRLTLAGVSHFAPLQRPQLFNDAVLDFLGQTRQS